MKTVIAVIVLACASLNSSGSEFDAQEIQRISDAKSQVGKYPITGGAFLKSPCIVKELQRILGKEFKDYYHRFLWTCGTFQIEQKGDVVWALKRETSVGPGWASILFFNLKTEKMHLLWVRSSVVEGDIRIYGDLPLPEDARFAIAKEYRGWGGGDHVAVAFVGDEVRITLKRKMKDPVTKEVFPAGYRFNPHNGRKLLPFK